MVQKATFISNDAEELISDKDYDNAYIKYTEALALIEPYKQDFINISSFRKQLIVCYLGLGQCYYNLGDYNKAFDYISRIDTKSIYWSSEAKIKEKTLYYSLSADIFNQFGQKDKAEECYVYLNNLNSPLNHEGIGAFRKENYKQAIEELQKFLIDNPMNIKAYSHIAQSYYLSDNHEEAIKIYDFLIGDHFGLLNKLNVFSQIINESLGVYYAYGKKNRESGNIKKAIGLYSRGCEAINLYEENSKDEFTIAKEKRNIYFELAYSYYLIEDYEKAAQTFRALDEYIYPNRSANVTTDEFYDISERITSEEAKDAYLFYAIALEKTGKSDEARICYIEANKYYKKYPDEITQKGKTYLNEGNFALAIDFFNVSLSKRPYNMEAYYYIAKSYFVMDKKDQAIETCDFIIAQNVTDLTDIYVFKSVIEQVNESYKEAVQEEKKTKINTGIKRVIYIILAVVIFFILCAFVYFIIRKHKYEYSYVLSKLYNEIESMNSFEKISTEAEVDITGMDK